MYRDLIREMKRVAVGVTIGATALFVGLGAIALAIESDRDGSTSATEGAARAASQRLAADAAAVGLPAEPAPAETEPRWPEVARARIVTDNLNVRVGPGRTYAVVGRLQLDDQVPVAGRSRGGEWLGLPGIGWVAASEDWIEVDAPVAELPVVTEPTQALEFVGPLHPRGTSSGFPAVDLVIDALTSGDRNAVLALERVSAPAAPVAGPATAAPPEPESDARDGDAALVRPPTNDDVGTVGCEDHQTRPAGQLPRYVDDLVRSHSDGADTVASDLRLYALIRGPAPNDGSLADYVAVLAFEGGEGRQVWITSDGQIAQFAMGCEPTPAAAMLAVTPGEPFFWLRPTVAAPVDSVD